ncbi:hypothetical protein Ga0100231_024120 [Opitutaceae bacterium TAV4]|nr:hypothetical protein Ga0100231_024120 [Opitutaceae bacterium TAV4]RRK00799.1 hypothetical protein Ga0100230_023695 [Opitutaceae bacterium TAV3]
MKKYILLIAALAFGVGLFAAAPAEQSPTAQAVALNQTVAAITKDWDGKLALAKIAKDTAAVKALSLQRKASLAEHNAATADVVAALINDHIDEISANNAGAAATLIKRHLLNKNTVDGVAATVFDQNDADKALAARLLTLSKGSQSYFYYGKYATEAEIRDLPGTGSSAIVSAVATRIRDLGLGNDVLIGLYEKSARQGLVTKGYNAWFDKKINAMYFTNRAGALKLAEDEHSGIITAYADKPTPQSVTDRGEALRKIAAYWREQINGGSK